MRSKAKAKSTDDDDDNKKIIISAQITKRVWKRYDAFVEKNYGKYKKSPILEHIIVKYLDAHENNPYNL